MHSAIHKRVFTLSEIFRLNNGTLINKNVTCIFFFFFFVNQYVSVELEEWSILFIIWRISKRCENTFLNCGKHYQGGKLRNTLPQPVPVCDLRASPLLLNPSLIMCVCACDTFFETFTIFGIHLKHLWNIKIYVHI